MPMAICTLENVFVTPNAKIQQNAPATEPPTPFISAANSSPTNNLSIDEKLFDQMNIYEQEIQITNYHGMGPNPNENTIMYVQRATTGSHPIFSTLVGSLVFIVK